MEDISIVLPCYNHGKYVAEAIQSVLNQTYKDFVLYVWDNGSEDDSWEVINSFSDKRIRKIRLKKNDLLEVKKQFIRMAKGKYFAIMHADDVWMENKLEKQMEYISTHDDVRVCVTWASNIEIDDNNNLIGGKSKKAFYKNATKKEWYRRLFLEENWLSLPSLICDKEIYVRYFGKLWPYRQIADVFTWMKILQETNIHVVEEDLVLQRKHVSAVGQNESYPSRINLSRGDIEIRYAKYQLIDEMPDEVFLTCFCDEMYPERYSHLDVICKKFLFMAKDEKSLINGYENAVRYYDSYFEYEEDGKIFYQYLGEEYGFSRDNFFAYEEYLTTESVIKDIVQKENNIIWDNIKELFRNTDALWYELRNIKDVIDDVSSANDLYARFIFPWGAVEADSKIVIYGGGVVGKTFLRQVRNSSYCHVVAICDRNPEKTRIIEAPLISLDRLASMDDSKYDLVLVAIEDRVIANDICRNLKRVGIPSRKIKWIDPAR